MHTAQHQVVSAMPGAPPHGLTVGASVPIFSGYSNKQIGTGTGTCVLQRWVVVESSCWAAPVKFRTCTPLRGYRITGGVAEYLNEWIAVPSGSLTPIASGPSDTPAV